MYLPASTKKNFRNHNRMENMLNFKEYHILCQKYILKCHPLKTLHPLLEKPLTLYHKIQTFNNPKEEGFGQQCFLALSKPEIIILATFNPFPNKPGLVFTCLQDKSFQNTLEKGEIARNKQFLLFPQCFLATWRTFHHFHQT